MKIRKFFFITVRFVNNKKVWATQNYYDQRVGITKEDEFLNQWAFTEFGGDY